MSKAILRAQLLVDSAREKELCGQRNTLVMPIL